MNQQLRDDDLDYSIRQLGDGRHQCPACGPHRKKKGEKTLSVTEDGEGLLYNCWHCDMSGKVRHKSSVDDDFDIDAPAKVMPITKKAKTDPVICQNFLISRGITPERVDHLKIVGANHFFHGAGDLPAVGFRYEDTATKWRSIEGKRFIQDGAAQTLWNVENDPGETLTTVIITEGEMDAVSIVDAIGKRDDTLVVSVPNGAPQKVSNRKVDPEEDRKFAYLWKSKDIFEKADKIVLAMDTDEPGEALGEEIMRRVGRAKCYHLEIPEGCKDANDVLMKHGPEYLADLVEEATPTPLVGVYSADDYSDDVQFLYDRGLMNGKSTGYAGLDGIYTILEGQLTVVTGLPGSGKSEWIDSVMVNLAEEHDWKFAIASFENPPAMHIIKLAEKRMRKPFFEGQTERMTEAEMTEARGWVNDHFAFLDSKDGEAATIDNIIDRTKQAVMRLGCRGLVIDPYNYIAQNTNDQEHQAISEMLTRMVQFARSCDLHIWFIAHPAKMRANENGTMPVPNGNHISGSAAWFAKADCGITVHRLGEYIEVHSWKCRFKWIGTVGSAKLSYDPVNGRYKDYEDWEEQVDTDSFASRYAGRRDYHERESDWDI
jgi:twinkle protein